MQRSHETFQIAPEDFFAGLDRSFADLNGVVARLATRTDDLWATCLEMLRTRLPAWSVTPPTRWSYDARLPNFVLADVFEPEPLGSGAAKRWVGRGGRVVASLRMPRDCQYDVAVEIEDFANEPAAKSFYLRIGGEPYPWLENAEKRYTSIALEKPDADTLDIEFGVAPDSVTAGEVTFSFRSIEVQRR